MSESIGQQETGTRYSLSDQSLILRLFFIETVKHLKRGDSVYLSRFGLLTPRDNEAWFPVQNGATQFIRRELRRTVIFEKTDDPGTIKAIELPKIARGVFSSLPPSTQIKNTPQSVKRVLEQAISSLKNTTVEYGLSAELGHIGRLVALHNRQGKTLQDWFAGCDLFLASPPSWCVEVREIRAVERPRVTDMQEVLDALHESSPTKVTKLTETLSILLYRTPYPEKPGHSVLFYSTDGLAAETGRELSFQLAVSDEGAESPEWPLELLSDLANADKVRSLPTIFDFPLSISAGSDIEVRSLLCTELSRLSSPLLLKSGECLIVNLLGITADESEFGRQYSSKLLESILKHRGLNQITRSTRSSVLGRSSLTD